MILKIPPKDGQTSEMLNFTWEVKEFKKSILTIQIIFKNPLFISYSQYNNLEITFKNRNSFRNS